MKVSELINTLVRPLIGDGYPDSITGDNINIDPQPHKYSDAFLISLLNEVMQELATDTTFFVKTGVALLNRNDVNITAPKDFLGLVGSDDVSLGEGYDTEVKHPTIRVKPTPYGFQLAEPLTGADISALKSDAEGVVIPHTDPLVEQLVLSGQLEVDNDRLLLDIPDTSVLITYKYKYLPPILDKDADLSAYGNRGLIYALKWGIAGYALLGDLHNEALNVSNIYRNKYNKLKDNLSITYHNWNSISLSPFTIV